MRQDKDRCFKFNTPNWKPCHNCKDKRFFNCEINKSYKDKEAWDISSSDEEKNNEDSRNSHESRNQNAILTLFVTPMMGISQPQTIKVYGYVKKTKVTILIDSGSSHKFIDTKMTRKLTYSSILPMNFKSPSREIGLLHVMGNATR
jgi:hypothetical protein